MRYLIDTNIWIIYLKQVQTTIRDRLAKTLPHEVNVCSVVWAELLHGARKYGNAARRETMVEETLSPFVNHPFDLEAAHHYTRIRDELEGQGGVIGGNDLMIAAIAITHNLIVVTHNSNEFSRVYGRQVEDWTWEEQALT